MKFYRALRFILVVSVLFVLSGSVDCLNAQAGRGKGRMKGSVKNVEGKKIENAEVEIILHDVKSTGPKIKLQTKTNKKGKFSFNGIVGGTWEVFVAAEGYKEARVRAIMKQVPNNPAVKVIMRKLSVQTIQKTKLAKDSSLIEQGNKLYAEAKYDEALEIFNKYLLEQPEFYQTYFLIGNCYREKGDFDTAEKNYKLTLEKAPEEKKDVKLLAKVQSSLGELYIRKKDLKTAQEYFKKSLELDPKDENLAYTVGEIFFNNSKTTEAIHYFKLAAQIKPTWGTPYLKIGYAYLNSADYKNAVASFNKFLELDPESAEAGTIKELIKSLKDM